MTLEERVELLEKRVAELDSRTVSMIRLGPMDGPSRQDMQDMMKMARDMEIEIRDETVARVMKSLESKESAEIPPVDRSARELSNGCPETADHREIDPRTGQQKGYIVLTAEERSKGFVRPVRRTYTHLNCGTDTTMGLSIAETYARDPGFYSGTFCFHCRSHGSLSEFVWKGTAEQVGS